MPNRPLSKFELYELTVQKPAVLVPLLQAIHGRDPRVLGEDFCGTAALSREWVRRIKGGRAVGADVDPVPLAHAQSKRPKISGGTGAPPVHRPVLRKATGGTPVPPVRLVEADVLTSAPILKHRADVLFVGNFSIGEIHRRRDLVRYFKRSRARLRNGGVFICDTYGGESAFATGAVQRLHDGPKRDPGLRIRYTWQQRKADPLTGMVENALHYRTDRAGTIEQEMTDAFVYHWRLWSIAELREAMHEAGFATTEVYNQVPDATDASGQYYVRPVTDPDDLDDSFIVCVVGRTNAFAH